MKVLYIINSLITGGAETILARIISNINNGDIKILVVTFLPGPYRLEKSIKSNGIEVYNLKLLSLFSSFKTLYRLISIIRKYNPDVTHTFLAFSCLIGGLVAKYFSKSKIIWSIYSTNLERKNNKIGTFIAFKLCAFLSSIIPNEVVFDSSSAFTSHQKIGYNPNNCNVINNGVNTKIFKPDNEKKHVLRGEFNIHNCFVVGTIARFHPDKGYDTLIKAIEIINNLEKKILFLLCGRDLENEKFLGYIKARKIDNVIIVDENSNVIDALHLIDLYVSSSYTESFPNILCEAMACGIPCISTDVGDSAKIVGDIGIVVRPKNVNDIVNAIISFYNITIKEKRLLDIQVRQRVIRNFELKFMIDKYIKLYKKGYIR